MKTKRLNAHMKTAYTYAELSYAKRLKVGAVLVRDDRIVSIGYNGTLSGGSNICEVEVAGELVTKKEAAHAEMNCIAFAALNGISTKGCTLVTTDSPCYDCCKLLIQAGIKEIYFDRQYRDRGPLDLLKEYDVKYEKVLYESQA